MAFKLKPAYQTEMTFPDLTNSQILILALDASAELKWSIEEISMSHLVFATHAENSSEQEEITFTIDEANHGTVKVESKCLSFQFVDYGKNKQNILCLKEQIDKARSVVSEEELIQKAQKLEDDFNRLLAEEKENAPSFLSLFIPKKDFWATPVLIDLNILVFLLMVISGADILSPNSLSLLKWGADFGPLTFTGDWWRTITCNFVHIGAFHLLMNMYALMFIGIQPVYTCRDNQCRGIRCYLRFVWSLPCFPYFS